MSDRSIRRATENGARYVVSRDGVHARASTVATGNLPQEEGEECGPPVFSDERRRFPAIVPGSEQRVPGQVVDGVLEVSKNFTPTRRFSRDDRYFRVPPLFASGVGVASIDPGPIIGSSPIKLISPLTMLRSRVNSTAANPSC